MLKLARLRTGQFVLTHDPSGTVVVAERLEEAYAQMTEQIGTEESSDSVAAQMAPETARPSPSATGGRSILIAVLVLLPFLWLAILHYSLGALLDEGIQNARGTFAARDKAEQVSQQMEQLKTAQSGIEKAFSDLKMASSPAVEDIKQIRAALDALRQQTASLQATLEGATTQLGAASQSITELRQSGDALKARVDALPTPPTAVPVN